MPDSTFLQLPLLPLPMQLVVMSLLLLLYSWHCRRCCCSYVNLFHFKWTSSLWSLIYFKKIHWSQQSKICEHKSFISEVANVELPFHLGLHKLALNRQIRHGYLIMVLWEWYKFILASTDSMGSLHSSHEHSYGRIRFMVLSICLLKPHPMLRWKDKCALNILLICGLGMKKFIFCKINLVSIFWANALHGWKTKFGVTRVFAAFGRWTLVHVGPE